MVAFIDAERETYGVEPMGAVLPIATATCPPSAPMRQIAGIE